MGYVFKNTSAEEKNLQLYSNLLSLTFPDTKKYTPEFLNWQYNLNPAGTVVGFDAFYDNELVGHYVTLPVFYTYNGEKIKGLLSLNTATHQNHQGKGLFTQLATKTYEYATEQDFQFVVGVANQNSTHGFIKKLGFTLVSPLAVKIFIGEAKLNNPNLNFFQSVWTKELAEWRVKNPSNIYFKNKHNILSKTHISFINAVLSQKAGLVESVSLGRTNSLLKMTIGNNLKKSGWMNINLPDKFKPSPLNLIFKSLTKKQMIPDKDQFYFELVDFDAY